MPSYNHPREDGPDSPCPICQIEAVHTPPTPSANERQVGGEHYRSPIQHWDYVLANDIPYLEAQIIKYVTRWRKKGGLQDLQKAKHFLDKLIEVNTPTSKDAQI